MAPRDDLVHPLKVGCKAMEPGIQGARVFNMNKMLQELRAHGEELARISWAIQCKQNLTSKVSACAKILAFVW